MPESNTYSFTSHFKIFWIISLVLCSLTILGIVFKIFGLPIYKLDMVFTGGVQIDLEMGMPLTPESKSQIEGLCENTANVTVSIAESTLSKTGISLKSNDMTIVTRQLIINEISNKFGPDKVKLLNMDYITEAASKELNLSLLKYIVFVFLSVLVYFSIRFGFNSGIAALICLLQNIIVMLLFHAIFQIKIGMAFTSAALIVFAYSTIQIIIVFDAVRERKIAKKNSIAFSKIVDRSILATLRSTLNIMFTALMLVIAMYFIGALRTFAFPLIVGIIAGAYSSIFIAGPLWRIFEEKTK